MHGKYQAVGKRTFQRITRWGEERRLVETMENVVFSRTAYSKFEINAGVHNQGCVDYDTVHRIKSNNKIIINETVELCLLRVRTAHTVSER